MDRLLGLFAVVAAVVVVTVLLLHVHMMHLLPPVDLIEDQYVGIRLADGANDPGRDGVHVALVLGRRKGLDIPLEAAQDGRRRCR